MAKYSNESLTKFCEENNITLRKDYTQEKVNRDTKIIAKCIECDNDMVEKSFRFLMENRAFHCKECRKDITLERRKITNVERFGYEYTAQNEDCQKKAKATNVKKYGHDHPMKNKDVQQKGKNTNLERRGVENPFQAEDVKLKIKNTNLENLGVENPSQNENVKQKIEATCLERYGGHPQQNKDVRQKGKNTNLERRGVENPFQAGDVKLKIKNTNLENLGVENPAQNENVKQKIEATCLERYGGHPQRNKDVRQKGKNTNLEKRGCENPMQDPEIAEKCFRNAHKFKKYIYPSGKVIEVQGYEPFAINYLLYKENIDENDIITGNSNVPVVWYYDSDGNKHKYYMDIYILSQDRGIEVKSAWTYMKTPDKNIEKWTKTSIVCTGGLDIYVFDKSSALICIKCMKNGEFVAGTLTPLSFKLPLFIGDFY